MLRRAARKGNSRTGAIAGKMRRPPDVWDAPRTAPDVGDSRRDTILCIKQKAAQYDIPRVSYLRFVHISSVSRAWRDHIGIRQPTAVYTTCTMRARARNIFIIIHMRTCMHRRNGCACRSHITVVKGLHFRFGGHHEILSNSKWCSDYDKTKWITRYKSSSRMHLKNIYKIFLYIL